MRAHTFALTLTMAPLPAAAFNEDEFCTTVNRHRAPQECTHRWNASYCNSKGWREAVDDGWSVISTITFRAGETVSFVTEC